MKTFKIVNGDLVFDGQNNLAMVDGNKETAQSIERTLTTNVNEWFLNIGHGLDYRAIQGKGKDKDSIKLAITEAIMQDNRVVEVEEVEINLDKYRNMEITAKVRDVTDEILDLSEVIDLG